MLPIILGQAPSRGGDGTPFSGESGKRLLQLTGLPDRKTLEHYFELANLLPDIQPRSRGSHAGDEFDPRLAQSAAFQLFNSFTENRVVIACGTKVWRACFGERRASLYAERSLLWSEQVRVSLHLFPHPSGASHYWNDPMRGKTAAFFLRRFM